MNDSTSSLKDKFDKGMDASRSSETASKEELFKKLKRSYIDNYAPTSLSVAERNKLSFQVSVSAAKDFFTQKDSHLSFVDEKNGILVKMIYNLHNKVRPSDVLGFTGISNGKTYTAKEFLGGKDVTFSHVKTASSGAISGCKVRATIWMFKVEPAEVQLVDDQSHDRYFDIYLDPYSDFKSSKRILGMTGRCGDLSESEDLKERNFPIPTDVAAAKHLVVLESILEHQEIKGIKFLTEKILGTN